MAGKFLIELTDPRFFIDDNADVIDFIRRVNPFAHSDVGSMLFEIGGHVSGAHAYCPVPAVYSYVALHTGADRIFAIAYGMRGLAFRLEASDEATALSDGGVLAPDIGAGWTRFEPWGRESTAATHERLLRWGRRAFEAAGAR